MKKMWTQNGRRFSLLRYGYSNIIIPLLLFSFPGIIFAQSKRYEFTRPLMGSQFRLVFFAENDSLAKAAANTVFSNLEDLNFQMSDYLDGSELNRVSALSGRNTWIRVSPELFAVLDSAQAIAYTTRGAYDATIGPVIQLWRKYFLLRKIPTRKEIRQALKKCDYRNLEIDRENGLIKLKKKGMRLDLGGIGKGYAADLSIQQLKKLNIRSAMVDAGGDLALADPPPGQTGWKIAISSGKAELEDEVIELANCGIATSGATYRYIEVNGKKYSHIVDPRKGTGITKPVRVTIIAPSATKADAMATAVSIADKRTLRRIRNNHPELRIHLSTIK